MKKIMDYLGTYKAMLVAVGIILAGIAGLIGSYQSAPPADYAIGAIPGNEVQGDEFIIGENKLFVRSMAFSATSSNVCGILTPPATTSLVAAALDANTGVTGVIEYGIARGASSWATTTLLAVERVTAGNSTSLAATSTGAAGSGFDGTFAPSSYINFYHQGGAGSITSGVTGTCSLILQVL